MSEGDSLQEAAREFKVISSLWERLEQWLASGEDVDAHLRRLSAALPPLHSLPTELMADLARRHAASAADLMRTARLVAPDVFAVGGEDGGEESSSCTMPNVAALDSVSSGVATMLSSLIELQLWHLMRARAMTACMRARVAAKQPQQGLARAVSLTTSGSSSSGWEMTDGVESLE